MKIISGFRYFRYNYNNIILDCYEQYFENQAKDPMEISKKIFNYDILKNDDKNESKIENSTACVTFGDGEYTANLRTRHSCYFIKRVQKAATTNNNI